MVLLLKSFRGGVQNKHPRSSPSQLQPIGASAELWRVGLTYDSWSQCWLMMLFTHLQNIIDYSVSSIAFLNQSYPSKPQESDLLDCFLSVPRMVNCAILDI